MEARGRAYLLGSVGLIAAYPLLSPGARTAALLVVTCSAVGPVLVGLRRARPVDRRPWRLLLAALVVLNLGNLTRQLTDLTMAGRVFDALGNVLMLVAVLAVVVRRGRDDVGGLIDTIIVSATLGGLLWDVVLLPRITQEHPAAEASTFATVFVLAGVLGALVRLLQTAGEPIPALWLLVGALALSLTGNVVLALHDTGGIAVAAEMMFMAAYVALGLFGLDDSAHRLARLGRAPDDILTRGRLAFLGGALAALPLVGGGRQLLGEPVDGLLLVAGAATITPLVMWRIGRLSAQRARAEQALRYQAAHDPLTGLPNRREFVAQLRAELRRPGGCVILFCDLDGFKAVNDRLGHPIGDRLLVEVARRLGDSVRAGDLVSRFGGDEFLVLFRDAGRADVERLSARIVAALREPVDLGDESVPVRASIGAVIRTGAERDVAAEDLIHRADEAMYAAKQNRDTFPGVRVVSVWPG
ncbi:GGDEF domain-containing protein [Longispora sp. K20-0274]|uniref:diguanylate cyclase domain-containing protein n=1 Tax=Longispora sp. K20-0274 TaxID=3088255 RepID=UPI00399AB10B